MPGFTKRINMTSIVIIKPEKSFKNLHQPKSLKSKMVPFKKSEIPLPTVGFSKYLKIKKN